MQSKEKARQILREGILDMNVERLVQMTRYGLVGEVIMGEINKHKFVSNAFNRMEFIEENRAIIFMLLDREDTEICYATVGFCIDGIDLIWGCDDEEHPEDILNINIELLDGTGIIIRIEY